MKDIAGHFELEGDFGSLATERLVAARHTLSNVMINGTAGSIRVDVSKLTYCGAVLLGLLVEHALALRSQDREMILVGADGNLQELLCLLRVDRFFSFA
jgi:anti-anti-sigma regulatory factor